MILVKETYPIDLIRLPVGPFYLALLHPDIKINTKEARKILPKNIPLDKAVKQWGNTSALTYGFTVNDIEIISSSMNDMIIEPVRSKLIHGFNEIKQTALSNGAIGSSISGSGPTIFALCANEEVALQVMEQMEKTANKLNLQYNSYVSSINHSGPQIIK